jgi:undecaprenyl-phosphate 4-deoxy-4-formamido-L-arabinose transferase
VGVPGFSALIVSILFSTGVILLGIGMMSEYLAHTFLHVIRKPQSVVRETTARK